jgi:8-oxo-dGTP diphosphatase
VSELRLRHSVRALIVDEVDRVLLCRWDIAGKPVWGTPGGGIEEGESHLAALRRELLEEVGLTLETESDHVWHQEVVPAQHTIGFDGVINDFYLVRTSAFEPRVTLFDEQLAAEELAAEELTELRWWPLTRSRNTSATPRSPLTFSPLS